MASRAVVHHCGTVTVAGLCCTCTHYCVVHSRALLYTTAVAGLYINVASVEHNYGSSRHNCGSSCCTHTVQCSVVHPLCSSVVRAVAGLGCTL